MCDSPVVLGLDFGGTKIAMAVCEVSGDRLGSATVGSGGELGAQASFERGIGAASARYVADRLIVMYAGQIAESGPVEDVLAHPKHPYTQLLLSAVPDPRAPLDVTAETDRGEPPRVVDPAPGCRFRWRCPLAIDTCHQLTPELSELLPGHDVACHVAQAGAELRAFG